MRSIVVKIGSSSVTRSTGPDPVVRTSALDAALTKLADADKQAAQLVQLRYFAASFAQRKPTVALRSRLGAINRYLPCWLSSYACGKYHREPCG